MDGGEILEGEEEAIIIIERADESGRRRRFIASIWVLESINKKTGITFMM